MTSHGRPLSAGEAGRPQPDVGAGPAAAVDLASPRENGTLAVIDPATGRVRSVTEVGPYAAAPGLAREPATEEER